MPDATASFTVAAFLPAALLGGLLGTVGQGVRAIIGLKKARDAAAQLKKDFAEVFRPGELALSLVIGFVAGVLGLLTLQLGDGTTITMAQIVSLIAIGYAGTDFIEGFMQRTLPDLEVRAANAVGDRTAMAPGAAAESPVPSPPPAMG
jgi:hypothetical protein